MMDGSLRALPGAEVETHVAEEPRRFEDFFGSEHARLFGERAFLLQADAQPVEDDVGILVGDEPDRDVGFRFDGDHRLLEDRRATGDAVHVDGRLRPGAGARHVDQAGAARVHARA